ncbi:hypothetical protein AVEN_113708-1 [Araneus ventricosus]|uniref:Uncharacterized protein n=1 Tax=Araneus ventricosus TaxID=182803 RepID=A0A4Y2X3I5_ARAVE|nr:hypothetical protein AVEN_113708-1 [Araneus ventricosus]
MIYRSTGPIHDGSSVESGFEPGTLRLRGRDLTTRTPRHRSISMENDKNNIRVHFCFRKEAEPSWRFSTPRKFAKKTKGTKWCAYNGKVSNIQYSQKKVP